MDELPPLEGESHDDELDEYGQLKLTDDTQDIPDVSYYDIITGRPSLYDESKAIALFEHYKIAFTRWKVIQTKVSHSMRRLKVEVPSRLPTVAGYCRNMGIGRKTFYRWLEAHEDFRHIYEWGKTVVEEMVSQRLYDGKVDPNAVLMLNRILNKYDDEFLSEAKEALETGNDIEETPERLKGYNLAEIDKYCKDKPIEAEFSEVMDGQEKDV